MARVQAQRWHLDCRQQCTHVDPQGRCGALPQRARRSPGQRIAQHRRVPAGAPPPQQQARQQCHGRQRPCRRQQGCAGCRQWHRPTRKGRGKHQSAQPGGLARGQFNSQRARERLGEQDEGTAGQLRPQLLGKHGVILWSLRGQRDRLRRQTVGLECRQERGRQPAGAIQTGQHQHVLRRGRRRETDRRFLAPDSHATSFAGKHHPHRQATEPLLRLSCCFAGQGWAILPALPRDAATRESR